MLEIRSAHYFGVSTWRLAAVQLVAMGAVALVTAGPAAADTITFGGAIAQSTQDGTGPAANNPDLNNIEDGDLYVVTLDFTRFRSLVPGRTLWRRLISSSKTQPTR